MKRPADSADDPLKVLRVIAVVHIHEAWHHPGYAVFLAALNVLEPLYTACLERI